VAFPVPSAKAVWTVLPLEIAEDHSGAAVRSMRYTFLSMLLDVSPLEPTEAESALAVVSQSFAAQVAPDYVQEGRDLFAQVVTAAYLRSLPYRRGFTLVAKTGGRIVGVIAFRDGHHITLFFVLPEYQGRGVGRQLFDAAVNQLRTTSPGATKLEVHSSPIAVSIYRALGFTPVGPETVEGGIRFVPMERPV
jgi:GNAT superfamily N-acetyltransferase